MRQREFVAREITAAGCGTVTCDSCGGILFRLLCVETACGLVDAYTFECRGCGDQVQINLPAAPVSFH